MTTTATHTEHGNTPVGTLFAAFELSEKTWKLGFTTGPGQKQRERNVAARNQERVLEGIGKTKHLFSCPSRRRDSGIRFQLRERGRSNRRVSVN